MPEPSLRPRRTLANPATVRGTTLFTAVDATLTIRPAGAGGLRFVLTSHPDTPVPALALNAAGEPRRTIVQATADGPSVQTVEHLLSALAATAVTDAVLELTAPEVPIADGSARPFVEAILAAGFAPVDAPPLAPIRPLAPLVFVEGEAAVHVTPRTDPGCRYTYQLDYGPDAPLRPHEASFTLPAGGDPDGYLEQIAPARTFSTLQEVTAFRQAGLFTHLTPAQMLVIGPDGPIDNTLRFPDEPARHKVLDLIGDLALAGRPIQADIVATRSGHALNRRAAAALAESA